MSAKQLFVCGCDACASGLGACTGDPGPSLLEADSEAFLQQLKRAAFPELGSGPAIHDREPPPNPQRKYKSLDCREEGCTPQHPSSLVWKAMRCVLDSTFANDDDQAIKPVFAGMPCCETIWVGVTSPKTSSGVIVTGRAQLRLTGTRFGLPFEAIFELAAGQVVGIHGDGMDGATLDVIANSIPATNLAQVVASGSAAPLIDNRHSVVFRTQSVTAGTLTVVPWGTRSITIPTNQPQASWDWVNFTGAAVQTLVPGPTAPGSSDLVRGSHFTPGSSADVVWTLVL